MEITSVPAMIASIRHVVTPSFGRCAKHDAFVGPAPRNHIVDAAQISCETMITVAIACDAVVIRAIHRNSLRRAHAAHGRCRHEIKSFVVKPLLRGGCARL